MDASQGDRTIDSRIGRQLLSVVILVVSGLILFTSSSWGKWFGPEPPPPTMTASNAQRLWSASQQSGSGWSETVRAYEELAEAHPDNARFSYRFAYALHAAGDYERAVEAHRHAMQFPSVRGTCRYNLACALALVGRASEALDELEILERNSFFPRRGALPESDPDFDSIRTNTRFIELLNRLETPQTSDQEDSSLVPSNV